MTTFGPAPLPKSTCLSTEFNPSVTRHEAQLTQSKRPARVTLVDLGNSSKEKNQPSASHSLGSASQKLSADTQTVIKRAPSTCQALENKR